MAGLSFCLANAWSLEFAEEQKLQSLEESKLHFLRGNLYAFVVSFGFGRFDHGCLNLLDDGRRGRDGLGFGLCLRMMFGQLAYHLFGGVQAGPDILGGSLKLCAVALLVKLGFLIAFGGGG